MELVLVVVLVDVLDVAVVLVDIVAGRAGEAPVGVAEGDDAERLQKLVELVPGTAHWMIEMGDRDQNMYWAAKQGKWEFATYQSEEIEKLVEESCERGLGVVFVSSELEEIVRTCPRVAVLRDRFQK